MMICFLDPRVFSTPQEKGGSTTQNNCFVKQWLFSCGERFYYTHMSHCIVSVCILLVAALAVLMSTILSTEVKAQAVRWPLCYLQAAASLSARSSNAVQSVHDISTQIPVNKQIETNEDSEVDGNSRAPFDALSPLFASSSYCPPGRSTGGDSFIPLICFWLGETTTTTTHVPTGNSEPQDTTGTRTSSSALVDIHTFVSHIIDRIIIATSTILRCALRSLASPCGTTLRSNTSLVAAQSYPKLASVQSSEEERSKALKMATRKEFLTPQSVPYFPLAVKEAFASLTPQQRLYAHYMNWAGWSGTAIVARQLSEASLPMLQLFTQLFTKMPPKELRAAAEKPGSAVSPDDVDRFIEFVALLYSNMGNFLSFGDSKFIPSVSQETFASVITLMVGKEGLPLIKETRDLISIIYDDSEGKTVLGYPPSGTTAYYSQNIAEADALLANRFLESKSMSGYNTRVFKSADDGSLHIRLASAERPPLFTHTAEVLDGVSIYIEYEDHSQELSQVAKFLEMAAPFAENDLQRRMLDAYVKHFRFGNVDDHKESQKFWVADKGPAVETNIGFIESYRDPSGVRGEWEGFVAVVDKIQSQQFDTMVNQAEGFIARLPWGADFEKDVFTRPDFTSLKILGFASSGIPAGICIPNYDDIRQNVGFKNVYLDNVVGAINFDIKLNHLTDADWALYKTSFLHAMSVNVGVHELLGHGTGKLLSEDDAGLLNFDKDSVVNPLTGQPVTTWYKKGETWGSKFGGLANAYEECRAEAVALYLGMERDLLEIFNILTTDAQDQVVHVLWLNMIRAGLVGLEFYSPDLKQWRQAHMRARFCILQTLLRVPGFVDIQHDGNTQNLVLSIDASRIRTDGRAAIGELLTHLNVHKATANVEEGSAYFESLTTVSDAFVDIRRTVMALRKPRKQFVQPHTRLNADGTDVVLVEFDGSADGAILSMVERHRDISIGEYSA